MTHFGKYAVLEPVVHHFEGEPEYWWKIKPPTSGDELNLSRFTYHNRVTTDASGMRREFPPTNTEIMHREVALLFHSTNFPKVWEKKEVDGDTVWEPKRVEDGGEPVLRKGASVEEVEAVLREMPNEMVLEIWEAIADAVPGWGPYRPKAS